MLNSKYHTQAPTSKMSSEQNQTTTIPIENFKYSKRVVLKSILSRGDKGLGLVGQRVVVGGWVKSKREKKMKKDQGSKVGSFEVGDETRSNVGCCEAILARIRMLRSVGRLILGRDGEVERKEEDHRPCVVLLKINDGSCVDNLQVVIDSSMSLLSEVMSTGTSILVEGVLEQPLIQGKHKIELKAEKIIHVGVVDLKKYPLAKTRISLESLKAYSHLRPRTTTVASITRIRNTLTYATHTFFHNNGFIYVHMPVITTTDIGASSNMFQVTTLLNKTEDATNLNPTNDRENLSLEVIKSSIKEKSNNIEELKRSESNREVLLAALLDLQKANELALQIEGKQSESKINKTELNHVKDFFSRPAYLSVSAGLYLESYACALSSVYTFGPIFRAEKSQSMKQLAEMWMVEVELAFAELEDAMNCAEDFLKFIIYAVLNDCSDDMKFIAKRIDKDCIDRIQSIGSNAFARITYTEAVELLNKVTEKTFQQNIEWGINLSEEHESYLADEVYKQPVIIYDYPKEVKPFYVHVKEDGKTCSAFDIIAPRVGVLVRGSQKEENIDKISTRVGELGLPREQYDWYLDIRRHGTVKHSGFSVGFENVVMFVTGLDDIKDTIPFPRSYVSASI
ncbi:uncharacterized protein A4U43_C10F12880 [Asparagus officinalis]|uniref:Aminoacyl-tRNA synthetase class II (D/K/N) domain-containing protein n=1 Tax=Asparagus officinalis TaxID=4686 RepID=A0A5P1E479_ASPOF|nr:uncharacterized protein LOC109826334 [Asparagus officinalis]ONK56783.1 uncharacterized protein A4U43_C10F12880 [Asparagus officinalis]